MRLPFFRSRKRNDKEDTPPPAPADASKAKKAADDAPDGARAPAGTTATGSAADAKATTDTTPPPRRQPRRVPTEHVVDSIAYTLAAVPSLGPTIKAWRKLGFHVTEPYDWEGCQAAHIDLEGGGIRFIAADASSRTAAAELVRARLIVGAGLFGWTWSCVEPHRSALAVGQLAEQEFHDDCDDWDDVLVAIPPELTPTTATWLEQPPAEATPRPKHANSITRLDHVVLQVSASKTVAATYEKHFGLKGRTAAMNDRYYAFLKAGPSLIEIVGPAKGPGEAEPPAEAGAGNRPRRPGKKKKGDRRDAPGPGPRKPQEAPVTGGPWGLAFGSSSIDATVLYLQMAGIDVKDPHRATQGGRITGMPTPLGGIQLAFMGE